MSSSDGTITTAGNQLIFFAGHNSAERYTAEFWQATHDQTRTLYQDVVGATPGGVDTFALPPEPPTHVLLSISVLFLAALHWWRRLC
jgi:hypothetical protein